MKKSADDIARVTLRIPKDIHTRIEKLAKEEHRTLTGQIIKMLEYSDEVSGGGEFTLKRLADDIEVLTQKVGKSLGDEGEDSPRVNARA